MYFCKCCKKEVFIDKIYCNVCIKLSKKKLKNLILDKICEKCQKKYSASRSNQKHCSAKCIPKKLSTRICGDCKIVFVPTHFRNKYCSKKCGPQKKTEPEKWLLKTKKKRDRSNNFNDRVQYEVR